MIHPTWLLVPARTRLRSLGRVASAALLLSVATLAGSGCGQPESTAPSRTPPLAPAPPPRAPSILAPTPQPQQPATVQVPGQPIGDLPGSFAPLVDSVKAAVVNVEVTSRAAEPMPFPMPTPEEPDPFGGSPFGGDPFGGSPFGGDPFGGSPFGGDPFGFPEPELQRGIGSGVIIDARGLVLTNNHVVEGATSIRVTLEDGRSFDARILGRDPLSDIALIQLQGDLQRLPVARMGDSDALRVGDWVVAIGNPFGLASSVSVGIVSAKARNIGAGPYDQFLQTDAAINPGNSGGPLFNMQGEVVGVTTIIVGGGAGIGFAVPSNDAKILLPQLEATGAVTRGWLGVAVQDLTDELAEGLGVPVTEGALVGEVAPGGPAAKAGLRMDDVIAQLDGQKVESSNALTRSIAAKAPGTEVRLGIYRGGKFEERTVQLGTRPDFEGVAEDETDREPEEPGEDQRLGLAIRDMDPRFARARELPPRGALVVEVQPGSPADRAGLMPGEVIVEAAGKPIETAAGLRDVLQAQAPGDVVLLRSHTFGGKVLRALPIPDQQRSG